MRIRDRKDRLDYEYILEDKQMSDYMSSAAKTVHTVCPLCKRARNVYHVHPFDYRKVCTNCEITWQEDNY